MYVWQSAIDPRGRSYTPVCFVPRLIRLSNDLPSALRDVLSDASNCVNSTKELRHTAVELVLHKSNYSLLRAFPSIMRDIHYYVCVTRPDIRGRIIENINAL